MLSIHSSTSRGHANHGWLDSYHTFSFADYHNPEMMGFRALRVINEDRIAPAQGFGTHPHKDMEILTYVVEGKLAHRDSMGNGSVILPGYVQGMSAGTGVAHSEFNGSKDEPVHLLQIWIVPHTKNVTPVYGEWEPSGQEYNGWALAASPDGAHGSILIQQDARLYITKTIKSVTRPLPVKPGRYGWLQVVRGEAELSGNRLQSGDGAAFAFTENDAGLVALKADSELLLFDLA